MIKNDFAATLFLWTKILLKNLVQNLSPCRNRRNIYNFPLIKITFKSYDKIFYRAFQMEILYIFLFSAKKKVCQQNASLVNKQLWVRFYGKMQIV